METKKYSEQDMQDYAEGKFQGDQSDFETYLKENPTAFLIVTEYQQLFASLEKHEIPRLSFNLADAILFTVEEKQYAKEDQHFRILSLFLILIAVGALVTTFNFLHIGRLITSASNFTLLLVSAVLIVLFSIAFYRLDLKEMEGRFTKML